MINYMKFWAAKMLVELSPLLVIIAVLFGMGTWIYLRESLKRWRRR